MQPLGSPHPILFAHRGGRAHAKGNSRAAFAEARSRGVQGIESDVRVSSDGVPVLVHDAVVGVRRRPVVATPAAAFPRWMVTLPAFYTDFGAAFELSLDVKAPGAFEASVAAAAAAGAEEKLWLCGGFDDCLRWRAATARARVVNSTRLRFIRRDLASVVGRLRDGGVDAINLPVRDWNQRTVDIVHDGGLLAFGWDAHRLVTVTRLARLGCDGIYGDDIGALLAGVKGAAA